MKTLLTALDLYNGWVNAPTIDYLAGLARMDLSRPRHIISVMDLPTIHAVTYSPAMIEAYIEAEPVAEPWTEIADTWLALYRQDATDRAAIREISYGL